jgi:molybdopterin molybdotransferase
MEGEHMNGIDENLTVEEARGRILERLSALDAESVALFDALHRVLAQDVIAEVDIPPHANSAMDGYALRAGETAGASPQAPCRLRVIGEAAAGHPASAEVVPGTAIRIMTGAWIPAGADAVLRFEDTRLDGEWVEALRAVSVGKDLRSAGEDVRAGQCVLARGTVLRPAEIGMLSALGCESVRVTRRPRVGILATGDELVAPGAPMPPGKIRDANGASNAAQVIAAGGEPVRLGIASDDEPEISERLRTGLAQGIDLLLVSGGVSVGDFDRVKEVLAARGEIGFWRVRMKPGKPLAFGTLMAPGKGIGVPVIGMPGNPVSAMVSFEVFAAPAIRTLLGAAQIVPPRREAVLADGVAHKDRRRHYVRVRLEEGDGRTLARLTGPQGSGILSSMVHADALAILPEDLERIEPGTRVEVILLR